MLLVELAPSKAWDEKNPAVICKGGIVVFSQMSVMTYQFSPILIPAITLFL